MDLLGAIKQQPVKKNSTILRQGDGNANANPKKKRRPFNDIQVTSSNVLPDSTKNMLMNLIGPNTFENNLPSTSSASLATKKRPSMSANTCAPSTAGSRDAKRPKSNASFTNKRPTKEEKEINEKKMAEAIKMAMETNNVVRSANTHGVATSTLRGRLKKAGWKASDKPMASSSMQQAGPVQAVTNNDDSNNDNDETGDLP